MMKCFSTNILEFHVPKGSQNFHVDLLEYVNQNIEQTKRNRYSLNGKTAAHGEPNLTDIDAVWSRGLKNFLQDVSSKYFTEQTNQSLDFSQAKIECWYVVLGANDMSLCHVHPGADISGCYYVSIPDSFIENYGSLIFIDPRPAARYSRLSAGQQMIIQPKVGMGLVFPSWLEHYTVPHNESDQLRVSIAWNVIL